MRGAKGRWHGDLAMLGEGSQVAPTIGCRGAAAPYRLCGRLNWMRLGNLMRSLWRTLFRRPLGSSARGMA